MPLKNETTKQEHLQKLVRNSYLVVGSGPSAVAVCATLIQSGKLPIVFDTGIAQNSGFIPKNPKYKELKIDSHVQKNKKWFDSYVPYLQWHESNLLIEKELNICQSFGFGGFSRVWGGTFDFYENLNEWPVGSIPIPDDIKLVKKIVPHSQTSSSSLHTGESIQGCDFSDFFYQKIFKQKNLRTKKSTLAINNRENDKYKCDLQGSCIKGCSKDAIWFSGNEMAEWIKENKIVYFPNFFLEKIIGRGKNTTLVFSHENQTILLKDFLRVFLACGPLGTGAILVRSGVKKSIEIKDTATIFFAALSWRKKNNLESHHSLSQWWVELAGSRQMRAQFYSPSVENLKILFEKFRFVEKLPILQRALILRLHPFIFYLNSKDSNSLIMTEAENYVLVREEINSRQNRSIRSNLVKLSKELRKVGLFIPIMLMKVTPAGSGFHIGSSMPHGDSTDSSGRVPDWGNIHIVDASVLPTIEVGSITPTTMANAVRITREVLKKINTN